MTDVAAAVTQKTDAPFVELLAPDGAFARVYLDGAQVASWIPVGGEEQLFVSERALYGPGVSIRGGVPVCFPQFGPFGALPQHGFARNCRWRLLKSSVPDQGRVVFELTPSDMSHELRERMAAWPHDFAARLLVSVQAAELSITLEVENTGTDAFSFTAALHPYFRVSDSAVALVVGLDGCTYRDALRGGHEFVEQASEVRFPGNVDRVYYDAPDVLELHDGGRFLRIAKSGFADAVVWNPGAEGTASKTDFAPGDERHMVCVEAGAVRDPVCLEPRSFWRGTQRMTYGD
ncbi:MAG: D-hexose-6-phosphate mutarotase [Gemmatimonadaceae bacterium]|nr:D-hexose-6-phosphate mutarotase [Gemmatimonadaceae bacterium]